jgi:glycosyltransferase involved in cell wall biosynthesis
MKILLIHSYYKVRGGEDVTFEQEYALLSRFNEVRKLSFQNAAGFKGAIQFLFSIWNFRAAKKLKDLISQYQPDIIHVHNWHFATGPIIFRVANKCKLPVVLTIQNFRLICPSATLLRNDELYFSSIDANFPWRAVKDKVYRESTLLTFWLAFVIWFHRKTGTWRKVNQYIFLTPFAQDLYLNSSLGISRDQTVLKSNFLERVHVPVVRKNKEFLFIGRLSKEKGITTLLNAFEVSSNHLYIAGDGPMIKEVMGSVNDHIHYMGKLDKNQVLAAMNSADVLVFPSIWYEGMPLTILEAFAMGTPIIASNLGAMASMIRHGYNGLLFEAGNIESLRSIVQKWYVLSDEQKMQYRNQARLTYEEFYTPEVNYRMISNIYQHLTRDSATGATALR